MNKEQFINTPFEDLSIGEIENAITRRNPVFLSYLEVERIYRNVTDSDQFMLNSIQYVEFENLLDHWIAKLIVKNTPESKKNLEIFEDMRARVEEIKNTNTNNFIQAKIINSWSLKMMRLEASYREVKEELRRVKEEALHPI